MSWSRLSRWLIVILTLALTATGVFSSAVASPRFPAAQPGGFEGQALEHVSRTEGIPVSQLVIASTARSRLKVIGIELADFKVLAADGRVFGVSFDIATGGVVDRQEIIRRERQARLATFGVIDPGLFDRLQPNSTEVIEVAVWVAVDDGHLRALGRGPNRNLDALAAEVRAAQAPVEKAIASLGAHAEAAHLVPVVFADLNVDQIEALAQHQSVVFIEAVPQELVLASDDAATSDGFVTAWRNGENGADAIVAVHEPGGIDDSSPFFYTTKYWCSGAATGPGGAACTQGINIDNHATEVASVIASTHQWRRGGAWGLPPDSLLSANFQTFNNAASIVNSAAWAVDQGVDVINMSWGRCGLGEQDFYSRWADYLVAGTGVTIVAASGNSFDCLSNPQNAWSPSLGWNVISTGSYWDNDTGLRDDDVFSSFSLFQNPTDPSTGGDYEKPDVTGMGGRQDTGGCHGLEVTGIGGDFVSICGTSLAAPEVSALAAHVSSARLREFSAVGEAATVKAIILAGATRNIIDGANFTDCSASPVAFDCRDGVGAIDAGDTLSDIVIPGNWREIGEVTPESFEDPIDIPVHFEAGRDIRVAIAWHSTADCLDSGGLSVSDCPRDMLNADLDLVLLDPSGTPVDFSFTFANSVEIIDYHATVSGMYAIHVINSGFYSGTATTLGVAWNPDAGSEFGPMTLKEDVLYVTTDPFLGPTRTLNGQTTDQHPSFWDAYSGPGCSRGGMTGLEKVYQVTPIDLSLFGIGIGPGGPFLRRRTIEWSATATLTDVRGFVDVNDDLDIIILAGPGSGGDEALNTQALACGDTSATVSGLPALSSILVVVDGVDGSVADFDLTVRFVGSTVPRPH